MSHSLIYRVTVDWSPNISLWPLGRLCSWFRIFTLLPIRLSVILLPQSMWVPCMTMVFSISVFRMVAWSPMLVYGPIKAFGPVSQQLPMMVGPLMMVLLWMTVPVPIATLFVMVAVSSMVPLLYGVSSLRISWLASRRSSGFPVSFHQPCTFWTLTSAPVVRSSWMVSVISSSPLQEGFMCLTACRSLRIRGQL